MIKYYKKFLKKISPEIEVVSEETIKNTKIKKRQTFWLVDPIDGTSSYIKGGSEYTINAGLIVNQKPVAGIIYAPKKKDCFTRLEKIKPMKFLIKRRKSN